MTLEKLTFLTVRITQFSLLIPIFVALRAKIRKVTFTYLNPLFILLLLFIPTEVLSTYLAHQGNNLAFANFYRILPFFFYLLVFYKYLDKALHKKIILGFFLIMLAIGIIQMVYSPWDLHFQYYDFWQNLALITISFIALLNMKVKEKTSVLDYPIFWYSSAIFFYNSGTLLTTFVQNYFIQLSMREELLIVYFIDLCLGILQYILFAISFHKLVHIE